MFKIIYNIQWYGSQYLINVIENSIRLIYSMVNNIMNLFEKVIVVDSKENFDLKKLYVHGVLLDI